MKHRTHNQQMAMALATVAVTVVMLAAPAAADDHPWQLRVAAISMNPDGSSVFVPDTGERISYDSSHGVGFCFRF